MKKILCLIAGLSFWSLMLVAQNQDASTVYADFAKYSSIVKTADPSSAEYATARQNMLQLFPQLSYHAAWYSQHRQASNALTFAKAYVDMAMMPQFADMGLEQSENYASMTYFVASNYYNRKDYTNAVTYLQRHIDINASKNRAVVFLFLAKCYEFQGNTDAKLATLEKGLSEFPMDQDLLALSINTRLENGWYKEALPYIERAMETKRNDARLISLKGQCLEGLQRYEEAVNIYTLLVEQHKTLNNYKHYAINLYNCAVQYYPSDRNTAIAYFQRAVHVLKQVVANDPTSVLFTSALATAYLYTDQYDLLEATNARLRAMGAQEIEAVNAVHPELLVSDLQRPASSAPASPKASAPVPTAKQEDKTPAKAPASKSSGFRAFAQNYVEKEIMIWQQKDPFETIDEYKNRVTEQTRNQKVNELMAAAKKEYIARHSKKIRISDFKLQPYDAENRVFLIESAYGAIVLPVPRENDEARNFANTWKDVRVENPEFDIAGDEMVIRSVNFVTRAGKTYHYSDTDERKYSQTEINMQFGDINLADMDSGKKKRNVSVQKNTVTVGNSDVDINIPVNKSVHNNRFAFLIGNENYQLLAPVPYAIHDVSTMKLYCQKTMGIPESNIRVYEDATFGKMLSCVREIKAIADAYNGNIDIVFYYAGHGIPDEASKSAYLLPVDADGVQTETCYAVGRLYNELGQLGVNSVVVMMDACFSGSQRGEGMIVSARGVARAPEKADAPQGKMVTLSAATGEETAYPYDEQQHGMFTYYILKGLQDSKGKISLGDLADYVQTQVRQRSIVINHKSQTPTVSASPEATDWRKWNWK